jgi:hypothetical protein
MCHVTMNDPPSAFLLAMNKLRAELIQVKYLAESNFLALKQNNKKSTTFAFYNGDLACRIYFHLALDY